MAKYKTWPGNDLEKLIDAFLKRKGINPNDVASYQLGQESGRPPMLTLTMFYDEGPVPEQVELDRGHAEQYPRVSTENPNIIKEG